MLENYTQSANERCFQLIDADAGAIWADIESTPEDTASARWRKKLEAIAREYSFSSRFALMRILFARAAELDLTRRETESALSGGEEPALVCGDWRFPLSALTIDRAETLSPEDNLRFEQLLRETAGQSPDADEAANTALLRRAWYDEESAILAGEALLPPDRRENRRKLAAERAALRQAYRPLFRTRLTRREAFRLGHLLRFSLQEMQWFLLRVFDAEDDFSRYDSLRVPELPENAEATALAEEFSEAYEYSFSSVCFTGEGFYERYDHFDRSRREYQNLMQQVENYGGTTSYTEDSASFIRYSRLMAPLADNAEERAQALFAYYGKEEKERDISYYIPYEYLTEIDSGQKLYEIVFPVIGAAAGVLAVFAALLLFSFISASINAKKKDIGILRAVGARGIDVFKIFIVEGIAITLLCLVLGVAGSIAACAITNGILIAEAGLGYEFFLFGWENALILFGIAAVTSLIATVIPVAVFSKKRPVETIRSV